MKHSGHLPSFAKCVARRLLLICVLLMAPLSAGEPPAVCREAAFGVRELSLSATGRFSILDVDSADFDLDGYADFAAAVPGFAGGAFLLRGSPTGPQLRPFPFDAALRAQQGQGPLVLGDFNQDGLTDFAVNDSRGCIVGLNQSDGSFRGAPRTNCGNGDDLTTIDFDQDGWLDMLFWMDRHGHLAAVRGSGDGSFTSLRIGTETPVLLFMAVEPGDFNHDGWPDVAIVGAVADSSQFPEARDQTLQILLGDGSGAFHPFEVGNAHRLGSSPYRLAAADFNRDDRLDLAVTDASHLRAFLGDGGARFSLSEVGAIPVPHTTRSLLLEDFNGDGETDIALSPGAMGLKGARSRGYAILQGDGRGGFVLDSEVLADFQPPIFDVGTVAGDFNGDGRPDLVQMDYVRQSGSTQTPILVTTFENSCPVRVTKNSLGTAIVGQTVAYEIRVKNVAESTTVEGLKIVESGSAQGLLVNGGGEGQSEPCSFAAPGDECLLGTLLPGDEKIVNATLRVTEEVERFGPANAIRNQAEAVWSGGSTPTRSVDRIVFGADLVVTQEASPDPVVRGEQLTYRIAVTNRGTETATEPVLQNHSPDVAGVLTAPNCTFMNSFMVQCPLPDIPPGATSTVALKVAVLEDGPGSLTNQATVSSANETYQADNVSRLSTIVVPPGLQPSNAGFEEGELEPWQQHGDSDARVISGGRTRGFHLRTDSTGLVYQDLRDLSPGGTYSLRAWARGRGAAALRVRSSGGEVLGVDGPRDVGLWAIWQTLFRVPASGRVRIELETIIPIDSTSRRRDLEVLWDDIELQPVSQATILVPEQYPTIQAAMDAASDGDVVSVGPGIYRELLDFKAKAIQLEGRLGPADTILDAGRNGDAVTIASGAPPSAVLRGMTIRNGDAGVFVEGSPLIEGNWITDNGVGLEVRGGRPRILTNRVEFNGGALIGDGTAIGNRFSDNDAGVSVSGLFLRNEIVNNGGTLRVGAFAVVRDNLIQGNRGGGMLIHFANGSVIEQNLIANNFAENRSPGGGLAGGIDLRLDGTNNQVRINNNTIVANGGGIASGVILDGDGTVLFYNNLILSDSGLPVVTCIEGTQIQFHNNLVFNLEGPIEESCAAIFNRENNVVAEPLLVNAPEGDYRLGERSPAIDRGLNQFLPDTDFDGNPRLTDGNGDGRSFVDIGAFEHPDRELIAPARSRMRGLSGSQP